MPQLCPEVNASQHRCDGKPPPPAWEVGKQQINQEPTPVWWQIQPSWCISPSSCNPTQSMNKSRALGTAGQGASRRLCTAGASGQGSCQKRRQGRGFPDEKHFKQRACITPVCSLSPPDGSIPGQGTAFPAWGQHSWSGDSIPGLGTAGLGWGLGHCRPLALIRPPGRSSAQGDTSHHPSAGPMGAPPSPGTPCSEGL